MNPVFQVGVKESNDSFIFSIQEYEQNRQIGKGAISTCTMSHDDVVKKQGVCFMTLGKLEKRVELKAFRTYRNLFLEIKDGDDMTFVTPSNDGVAFSGCSTCEKVLSEDPTNSGKSFVRCVWNRTRADIDVKLWNRPQN